MNEVKPTSMKSVHTEWFDCFCFLNKVCFTSFPYIVTFRYEKFKRNKKHIFVGVIIADKVFQNSCFTRLLKLSSRLATFSFTIILYNAKTVLDSIDDIESNIRFNLLQYRFHRWYESMLIATVFNMRTFSKVNIITSDGT